MINFKCEKCNELLTSPDDLPGNKVRCPKCGCVNTIEKDDDAEDVVAGEIRKPGLYITVIINIFILLLIPCTALACIAYYIYYPSEIGENPPLLWSLKPLPACLLIILNSVILGAIAKYLIAHLESIHVLIDIASDIRDMLSDEKENR
ncbi:MAG: hypothetical protein JW745_08630 [Sedimentisphaerales bacterium]|nr:hypothetical protein [Sedimentisphaerales bacterium]MBN2843790.1 hypothetical protein [Sedimentisphaerales bacterium]